MITLFKKNETNFSHNGLGSLDNNILNPEVSWKDNGAFTLEFRYPLFSKHGFEIENSSIIRANDPECSNLFFVYKITPSMGYVTVLCYQISYKLAFNSINDTNIVNKNGQNALTQMSSSTQYSHSFVFSSDILTTANSRVVRKNPIEFLLDSKLDNSFINRWGGHIVRHNFNVAMNSAYGSNKGYTIRHRKDLKGYEAEFDESTVITRIRPMGYDGLMLPEIYVDSPLINAYTEPRIQQFEYSDVKVKQKDDDEGFATKELAYAELRRLANLEFSKNKVDKPDFSAKVEFVNLKETQEYQDLRSLKQVLPGDIVKVIHADDNFNIEAQMVEYKWNPLNQSYISITLGNYTKSFTSTVSKVSNTQNEISKIAQQAQSAWTVANGKNKVYSLTYKPLITASSVEGDLLYLKNGDKIEMWILEKVDGKLQWVLQVNDATSEELKAQMAQAKTDIVEAVDSANLAVDKANASVAAVQANTQLINDVNAIANNAKSQAQTAATNANTALTNANTAISNANKAISDAGKLSEDVLALDTIANQAKSDADTALINANKGITDAKTALNKATGVDTRVTTEITNVNDTLATKANSKTVDALSDTVSSQGTAISQNATDIKLKADSTVVNAIEGTVDSQGTLISQNASDIALKANKSSVDTLTGRVSANETAIDVTSQGVSTLVTKTDNTNTSLSQFKQDYEGFKGTVYSKTQTDTKISTVQQSVDNFKTTVSSTYSSKAETDNKVTAVQANVDKLGTNTAYAYSADGTDRFTTVYPNLNLGDNTKTFVGAEGGNNLTGSIRIDSATQKTQDRDFYYLTFKPTRDGYDWFRFYLIPEIAATNMTKVTVKPNTKYTFSALLKGTGQHTIYAYQNWTVPNIPWVLQINLTSEWKLYTFTVTSSNVIPNSGVHFFIRSNNGTEINLKKPKVEEGSTATPYMPSEKELTSNDIPKYVGYSVRQSENPKDFSWQPYGGLNSYKIIEATTSIEQNSKEIALKSNKSEVDTLSGRVSTAEGSITTMAGQIKLKANQTDVNTIGGKVSSLESSLTVQSGQITALNTKTDGQTTKIGKLESSYDGLTSTISSVKSDAETALQQSQNAHDKSIKSSTVTYQAGDSGTSVPTGVWATSIPTVSASQYLWTRTVFTLQDDTATTSYSVSKDGNNGVDGNTYYTHTAYAYSSDGTDRFTTVYPKPNLLNGTKIHDIFKGTGTANAGGTQRYTLDKNLKISDLKLSNYQQLIFEFDWKATGTNPSGYFLYQTQTYYKGTGITISPRNTSGHVKNTFYNLPVTTDTSTFMNIRQDNIPTTVTVEISNVMMYIVDYSPWMLSESEVKTSDYPSYIGTYSDTNVDGSTDPSKYTWAVFKGSDGIAGANAPTITNVQDQIYLSTSNTVQSGGSWGILIPTWSSGKYYWSRVATTFSDGMTTYSTPVLDEALNQAATNQVKVTQLTQNLDGFKTTVSNTYLSKSDASGTYADKNSVASQINQSATEITSNVQTWTNNRLTSYSTTQQTTDSITSAVANKADKSQITQLASDINLRVSKGDVTSQINLESGRTLIDTKQLLLNANNVKFSGSAFIPNAMIQNLSAEKITAGILNAANVNVINLNARSLTAGTISGTNLSLNLDTGAVQFQKGYIEGVGGGVRLDLDNNYFQSLSSQGNGFIVQNGIFEFYSSFFKPKKIKTGTLLPDYTTDGILFKGKKAFTIATDNLEGILSVKTTDITINGKMVSLLGNGGKASIDIGGGYGGADGIAFMGKSSFIGNLTVTGSKNAIHVTRDGVRATPAYETTESYLGDIGGNYTRENCEVWVDIEKLFSDTVNTDIAYHVFLQAYDDANFWVAEFKTDKFLIKSDKPMARFAWEIKAKRRGYENDRLVIQEGFDNETLLEACSKGIFKGDGENESTN